LTHKDPLYSLIQTVKYLRGPNGCAWDKEQTLESLTPHIIEEAYELVDAIESSKSSHIKEELGDALLHVVMLSCIAEEMGLFSLNDVAAYENEKMIRRHPHVFSNAEATTSDDVKKQWESIKKEENKHTSAMASIPSKFPALLQAEKIQKRAAEHGFDWHDTEGPIEKIKEEIDELSIEIEKKDIKKIEEEAGDLLFSIVNLFRKLNIKPESALLSANKKFVSRFKKMEEASKKTTIPLSSLSLQELEKLWENAKL